MQVVELVEIEDSTKLNAVFTSIVLKPRMICRQRITQQFIGDMRVDFRRTDAGVAEHLLYSKQVGTSFKQMGGKAVPKGVRADSLVDAVLLCQFFHNEEDHLAREARTTAVEENGVSELGLWRDV